jgi:hypothetical protein
LDAASFEQHSRATKRRYLMDKVACWSAEDRAALFKQTGAELGLANMIIEKDFWVCWTLKRLFGLRGDSTPGLIFKGGTSLSKAYSAIRRFSEDIDLSFDRRDLGYDGDRNPQAAPSQNKAKALIESLVADVQRHIASVLLPRLNNAIMNELGSSENGAWSLVIDDNDAQNLIFNYPASLDDTEYSGLAYLSRRVKLEFGARGDVWPAEQREIQSYAAEQFPDVFELPTCSVDVLALKRTFWEKATLLHMEHHRPGGMPTPQYLSRHYSDLASLADTTEAQAALADVDLLTQVADHKAVFFRAAWAQYDTARPGTLRLSPQAARLAALRRDYEAMKPMMFDDPPPSFERVMARIRQLESVINAG